MFALHVSWNDFAVAYEENYQRIYRGVQFSNGVRFNGRRDDNTAAVVSSVQNG
jgi:hypothetical protein